MRINRTKILKKWVAALESGKYSQGQGRLRDGDKYCCLGVLCDVIKTTEKIGKWKKIHGEYWFETNPSWSSESMQLSSHIVDKIGLTAFVYLPVPVKGYDSLVELNDASGYNFKQIARVIRKQFLGEK